MSEITLQGIRKDYGNVNVINDLNLEFEAGKFVTILGPSGCGKTTTLRMLAGLEDPTEGKLILAGKTVFDSLQKIYLPPEKRNLGLIFQSYALWPHMKVDRNIVLGLIEAKLPKNVIEARLKEALENVQLEEFRDRYPSELSGGQQQRIAVARLIASKNTILLMDEPLSNLDAVLRTEMRAELKKLHKELHATTIYVTHDQVEALTMSDVIVVMKDGIVQQCGSPYEIYHNPNNMFVAQFIGDPGINHFNAEVKESGKNTTFSFLDSRVTIETQYPIELPNVLLTIRPEDIQITIASNKEATTQAEIEIAQPTGSQTILMLKREKERFTVLVPGFAEFEPGSVVGLKFKIEKMNFFDPKTETNLFISKKKILNANIAG